MSVKDADLGVRILRDNGMTMARTGQIIFPPAMLREALIKRGLAEEVRPQKPSKATLVQR